MFVVQRSDKPISATQPFRKQGRVKARDRQAAALRRAVGREGSDDGVAAGEQGAIHDPQIGVLVGGPRQEVERGPIMPDVEADGRLPVQDVRHHPFDRRILRQSRAGFRKSGV